MINIKLQEAFKKNNIIVTESTNPNRVTVEEAYSADENKIDDHRQGARVVGTKKVPGRMLIIIE